MSLWWQTAGTLFPVFAIVGMGFALRRSGFLSREFFQGVNKLAYWVGLPALLFNQIARTPRLDPAALPLFGVLALTTLLLAGAAALTLVARRRPRPAGAALVQAAFRGNNVFVGLPVVWFATSGSPTADRSAELAVVALAFTIPFYNLLSLSVLLRGGANRPDTPRGRLWLQVLVNPLTLACLTGALAAWLLPALPSPVERTTATLGRMALPLALLSIGASITRSGLHRGGTDAVLAAGIKTFGGLLVAVLVLAVWPLDAEARRVALIMGACPTAVASYVLAQQLGADEDVAAGSVVVSTVLAAGSLLLALLL